MAKSECILSESVSATSTTHDTATNKLPPIESLFWDRSSKAEHDLLDYPGQAKAEPVDLSQQQTSLIKSEPISFVSKDSGFHPLQPCRVAKDNRFHCRYCPCSRSKITSLRQHIRLSHPEQLNTLNFMCKYCSQRFDSERALATHLRKSRYCKAAKADDAVHTPSKSKEQRTIKHEHLIYTQL